MHGLPVVAHNRYWAADTSYAKKNGGEYNFVVEKEKAIPADKVKLRFFSKHFVISVIFYDAKYSFFIL